jgi:SAM-dependent methyltransferase
VLNPGFTTDADRAYGSSYVVPGQLTEAIVGANADFATGPELRTQSAYGDELWFRLRELGVEDLRWGELDVLDACCGTGFLSHHLTQRVRPRSLTLLDVSPEEVREAERLVGSGRAGGVVGDLAHPPLAPGSFDVVIGNSFLHHFPDVPAALDAVGRLARPGGLVIGLHEPTPAALPLESGDPRHVAAYLLSRWRYLRRMRHRGPGPVRPGTTDVWLFQARELEALLRAQGFVDVRVQPRYLLRPFVVAMLGLHLHEGRPRLTPAESRWLRATVRLDAALRRVLPPDAFGGLSFVARRPG